MHDEFVCPGCHIPLRQTRMEHGIFWACPQCGGCALNVELLRRTFTDESINPFWLHAIRSEGKTGRDCPCCRHPMIEVLLANDPGAPAVDVCRTCHFVWFDASEIGALRPQESPAAPPPGSASNQRTRGSVPTKDYHFDDPLMPAWWQQLVHILTR